MESANVKIESNFSLERDLQTLMPEREKGKKRGRRGERRERREKRERGEKRERERGKRAKRCAFREECDASFINCAHHHALDSCHMSREM
jgi:hypothetical protein